MTPCEKRGYKVGQVFEFINEDGSCDSGFDKESVLVLSKDDGTIRPLFDVAKGRFGNDDGVKVKLGGFTYLNNVKRINPPEEKKAETIELMGKTYNKAEIEQALSNVLPVTQ